MGRGSVLAAALALTFMAVFVQALAGPGRALACSCMTPMPTIEEVAREPNTVVLAGVVGPQQPDRTPISVDTWFWGPGPTDVVWLGFGSQMLSSCDPFVTVGERRLMVLYRDETGSFSVNPCVESGVIGTEAGDAAMSSAMELFGGVAPPTEEPTEPPDNSPPATPAADTGWLYVAAIVGGGGLVLALVVLLALRRRPA